MTSPGHRPLPDGAPERLVLGTRTSALARVQADRVADALRRRWHGLDVEVRGMTTRGDRVLDRPLPEIGGKGLFTAELETALLDGEIDLAVHSLKDLPTALADGLALVGVPEREDPRDVLVWPRGSGGVEELPEGAVVGTSSLRRRAQLLAARPDLRVEDIRGNVDTRVEKCRDGGYDAAVLAAAGLRRLEMEEAITAWLSPPGWLPAAGQGALGLEGRSGDRGARALVAGIEDRGVAAEARAERALLDALDVGCRVPLGARASAEGEDGNLRLVAAVFTTDGADVVRAEKTAPAERAAALGAAVARRLRDGGAERILGPLREEAAG